MCDVLPAWGSFCAVVVLHVGLVKFCEVLVSRRPHVPKVQLTRQYQTDDFTPSQPPAQDTHPSSLHIDSLLPFFLLFLFSPVRLPDTDNQAWPQRDSSMLSFDNSTLSVSLANNFLPFLYTPGTWALSLALAFMFELEAVTFAFKSKLVRSFCALLPSSFSLISLPVVITFACAAAPVWWSQEEREDGT